MGKFLDNVKESVEVGRDGDWEYVIITLDSDTTPSVHTQIATARFTIFECHVDGEFLCVKHWPNNGITTFPIENCKFYKENSK